MNYRCPICKKTVETPDSEHIEKSRFFPFCSIRCKLVDLGAWFDADYKINSELKQQEQSDTYPGKK